MKLDKCMFSSLSKSIAEMLANADNSCYLIARPAIVYLPMTDVLLIHPV